MNIETLGSLLETEVRGDGAYDVDGVGDLERLAPGEALKENRVYFVENAAVLKRHPQAAAGGAVLTVPELADRFPRALVAPAAAVRVAFIKLLRHFDAAPSFPAGVSPDARVHPSAAVAASAAVLAGAVVMEGARVGERCVLYPGVVLEPGAVVGDGTVLFPHVVVGARCVVGRDCIVHAGTVLGADGFGFHDRPGKRYKVPQIGIVRLGDRVELGAGCTVDRATIEETSIGDETKIDDQVHIAHNCRVGGWCYIAANTGLAGSVVVEDGVMISGMVSVKDHVTLAKGTIVMGMSGVAQDTAPKTAYFGTPALPARQMHKMHSALERLPALLARVRELEARAGIAAAAD
ncbi:MAG: UDP-3-O-(3-hydroxymyristoyl)glucosamine N-acyltransferase [Elusimicrobia bacterium]|nr:UDP-3-O-(3-hydroxymyristoyl)glucosamine N-acyltransferase [Elusimicrobiota bacterium]